MWEWCAKAGNSPLAGVKRLFTRFIACERCADGRLIALRRQGVAYTEIPVSYYLLFRMELCSDAIPSGCPNGRGHVRTYLKGYNYGYREDIYHD